MAKTQERQEQSQRNQPDPRTTKAKTQKSEPVGAGKGARARLEKDEAVQRGSDFMPRVGTEQLAAAHRAEKPGKSKYRLDAAVRRRKGEDIRDIARNIGVSYSTTRDWLARLHNGDMDSRFDLKREGRKRSLPPEVDESIIKWLDGSPKDYGFDAGTWQLTMVRRRILEAFGIDRKVRILRKDFRRPGLSYHKPRPVPYNSATPEEQAKFKLETNRTISEYVKQGYIVVTQDEAHVRLSPKPGYGWYRINGNDEVKTSHSKKTATIYGVLSKDEYQIRLYESCNSETFISFLREMLEIYPKLLIVLDNASYHTSQAVEKEVEASQGALKLVFLPKYTPQLNPIEQQWNVLKRLLSGRYYESVEELKEAIESIVSQHLMLPVKLMDCLLAAQ